MEINDTFTLSPLINTILLKEQSSWDWISGVYVRPGLLFLYSGKDAGAVRGMIFHSPGAWHNTMKLSEMSCRDKGEELWAVRENSPPPSHTRVMEDDSLGSTRSCHQSCHHQQLWTYWTKPSRFQPSTWGRTKWFWHPKTHTPCHGKVKGPSECPPRA